MGEVFLVQVNVAEVSEQVGLTALILIALDGFEGLQAMRLGLVELFRMARETELQIHAGKVAMTNRLRGPVAHFF